jgi:hypothetical protein
MKKLDWLNKDREKIIKELSGVKKWAVRDILGASDKMQWFVADITELISDKDICTLLQSSDRNLDGPVEILAEKCREVLLIVNTNAVFMEVGTHDTDGECAYKGFLTSEEKELIRDALSDELCKNKPEYDELRRAAGICGFLPEKTGVGILPLETTDKGLFVYTKSDSLSALDLEVLAKRAGIPEIRRGMLSCSEKVRSDKEIQSLQWLRDGEPSYTVKLYHGEQENLKACVERFLKEGIEADKREGVNLFEPHVKAYENELRRESPRKTYSENLDSIEQSLVTLSVKERELSELKQEYTKLQEDVKDILVDRLNFIAGKIAGVTVPVDICNHYIQLYPENSDEVLTYHIRLAEESYRGNRISVRIDVSRGEDAPYELLYGGTDNRRSWLTKPDLQDAILELCRCSDEVCTEITNQIKDSLEEYSEKLSADTARYSSYIKNRKDEQEKIMEKKATLEKALDER